LRHSSYLVNNKGHNIHTMIKLRSLTKELCVRFEKMLHSTEDIKHEIINKI